MQTTADRNARCCRAGRYRARLLGLLTTLSLLLPCGEAGAATKACSDTGVWLQVLGSGGPELTEQRASSSYLVWKDGKARLLIDSGGGSAFRFGESGADFADLYAIAFTHLHVDHSADFAALIKASFFGDRTQDLPVLGPDGNQLVPSIEDFVGGLFARPQGVFRYLSDFVDASSPAAYKLKPRRVAADERVEVGPEDDRIVLSATPVHHGPIPALAWRVEIDGRALAFSGDMNGSTGHLNRLARDVDILVAHNAVPEGATGVARELHMPPSVIGEIAADAKVKHLVLSHRMRRTLGVEQQTQTEIRRHYGGPLDFADDLDCFSVDGKSDSR